MKIVSICSDEYYIYALSADGIIYKVISEYDNNDKLITYYEPLPPLVPENIRAPE